jgi:hypothetical protein
MFILPIRESWNMVPESKRKHMCVFEISIFVRYRKYSTNPNMSISVQVNDVFSTALYTNRFNIFFSSKPITSLSSSLRRVKALLNLRTVSYHTRLLNPNVSDKIFWCNGFNNSISVDSTKLNESQKLVVAEASTIVKYAKEEPKFYFIQGPPGTGKSYTIINIIREIFRNAQTQLQLNGSERLPRILICSPSNGGCDELARRLKRQIGVNFMQSEKTGSLLAYFSQALFFSLGHQIFFFENMPSCVLVGKRACIRIANRLAWTI